MPKLPDYTALGETPVARTSLGRTHYQPVSGKEGLEGQAVSGLGKELGDISNEIERENLRVDTLRAEDAYNEYLSKKQELSIGDNGFAHKRGSEATKEDLIGTYEKQLKLHGEDVAKNLGNDRQRALFNKRQNIADMQFKQDLIGHVTKEKDIDARQVFDAIGKTTQANMVDRAYDRVSQDMEKTRFEAALQTEAERNHWDSVVVDNMRQQWRSSAYTGIINRMIVDGRDIDAEKQYKELKNNKFVFTASDEAHVLSALDQGRTLGGAQRISDEASKRYGENMTLALDYVRKNAETPKQRQAAETMVRQMRADQQARATQEVNQNYQTGFEFLKKTGDVYKIPTDVQLALGERGMEAMKLTQEAMKNPNRKTDQAAMNDFHKKSANAEWLSSMDAVDFATKYVTKFSEEDGEYATKMRDSAIELMKNSEKAKKFIRHDVSVRQLVLGKIIESGLIDAKKKSADYNQDDEAIISNTTAQASILIQRFQSDNQREATIEDERQIVNGLILEKQRVKIKQPWYKLDKEKSLTEATPQERSDLYVKYKDVPISHREALRKMAAEMNIKSEDVSEDRIARAYTIFIQTKGLPRDARESRIAAILNGN